MVDLKSPSPSEEDIQNILVLLNNKEYDAAEISVNKFIDQFPRKEILYNILGSILYSQKKSYEAIDAYNKAISINAEYASAYGNLGTVYQILKKYDEAIINFKKAIEIKNDYFEALNNLGTLYQILGKKNEALSNLEKAISINPQYVDAHSNLGYVNADLEKNQKAIFHFQKAIEINKNYIKAYYGLGKLYLKIKDFKKAISYFKKAILINPKYEEAICSLGFTFNKVENYTEAISSFKNVIEINSNDTHTYTGIGWAFFNTGDFRKAIESYEKAISLYPKNLTAHWFLLTTFPIIYENTKQIDEFRESFKKNINRINNLLNQNVKYDKEPMLNALQTHTNFYLHYQGKNDFELQKKYAQLVQRFTKTIYPEFFRKSNKSLDCNNLKIGFISSFFRDHSIAKTHKNWILKLNKKIFKIFVYYLENIIFDETTNSIKKHVNYFFKGRNIKKIINQISKDDLDIIIHLDIGMDPNSQILGSLRLAPIQCLAMGHPVTSGFDNIDYVLSSELMEPKNGQDHYTEQLINLPNTGQCYELPVLTNLGTQNSTYKKDKIIFLLPQSLFKLLPRSDHIYIDIVKKYHNSQFWFIKGVSEIITNAFKNRVMDCFKKNNLQGEKYIFFHPRMEQNKFFDLINKADIILDSFDWSGNNTSHEAISLDKPIVTLPTQFMRGRHTYSILKILGINETIASSEEEYVDIAVRLAKDNEFRNIIVNKIKKNKHKLFNDQKPIKFLEDFLKKKAINYRLN